MALAKETLEKFRSSFYDSEKNRLAQNVITLWNVEASLQRSVIESTNHVFSHKLEEVKPVTNQKRSGRCWIFACLNAMRIPFMKENNLDEFEFSQAHVFYWDKIERCNYFLHNILEIGEREPKETVDGRLLSFLLADPISDGGQWDMIVNLIEKHGVMPKKCFPEAVSAESSYKMNSILRSKLREFAQNLHGLMEKGASKEDLLKTVEEQMEIIYRIVGICLSIPPETFTWEYYDKSKKYQKVSKISPLEFYETHVKPHFDVASKICLVSDPRSQNPVGKTYTVDCLGNVVGGRKTIYNNQTIDTLIELAAKSIKAEQPVWFGCDTSKRMASRQGILDLEAFDHDSVFGTDVSLGLSKADRMHYGDSKMNHAMVLTGVHFDDDDDKPTKWRIENSWGEDQNAKGNIVMTTAWFREFVFEIVVDKEFVSEEILEVFKQEPIVLPAWDPMGALA